jgi:hypothetical protein
MTETMVFLAVILVIACSLVGGLALLCRHAPQSDEKKDAQKVPNRQLMPK